MVDGRGERERGGSAPPVDLATAADPAAIGRRRRRGLITAFTALLCIAALVAVAVVTTRTGEGREKQRVDRKIVRTPETQRVVAALGETVATGSYTASYELRSTPGAAGAESCGDDLPEGMSVTCRASPAPAVDITGVATINTDPYRMVASSQVTGFGTIVIHVDGTRLWEQGGGMYGYTGPNGDAGSGDSISGFAGLVSGTLGRGPGALAMLTLANPNGYLDLEQEAVSEVTPVGPGVVNGVPVTYYNVVIDNAKLLDMPGLTAEQSTAIGQALTQLRGAGLRDGTMKVGIDGAGFIRETSSVAVFADGTRQASRTVFSNFGCAGFVQLPGEPPPPPPAPCASTAPTTSTTTVPANDSTTSSTSTTSATTAPG